MADDYEPKLDAKIIALVWLFQRFGRSLPGVLLLEIGWTVMIVLASKLGGDGGGAQKPFDIPFATLWLYGTAVVVLVWVIHSRAYAYLGTPTLVVLKPAVYLGLRILILLLLPLDLVRNWLIKPRRQRKESEFLTNLRNRQIKIYREEHPKADDQQAVAAADKYFENLKRNYGSPERYAAGQISLKRDLFSQGVVRIGQPLLWQFQSGPRIGTAPLNDYTTADGILGLRLPMEQFVGSISNFLSCMDNVEGGDLIRFQLWPAHFPVRTHAQAWFVRWFFAVDVLVWGHFGEDQQSARVHLCIGSRLTLGKDRSLSEDPRDKNFVLFPSKLIHMVKALQFSPSDGLDRHVVLLVAALHAIWSRQNAGDKKGFYTVGLRNIFYDDTASDILELLARDILPLITPLLPSSGDGPAYTSYIPTASRVAAELVSRWAGNCFNQEMNDPTSTSHWERIGNRRFALQLRSILVKCKELLPEHPPTLYRLGAVSCFLGDTDRALDEFREAGEWDQMSSYSRGKPLLEATKDFYDTKAHHTDDLAWARLAANAAATIYMGDGSVIRTILTEDTGPLSKVRQRSDEENPDWRPPPAIIIIKALLDQHL